MVAISRPWYNCSYTMAAKPIKSLELHYTMIQFLIKEYRPWKTAVDLLNVKFTILRLFSIPIHYIQTDVPFVWAPCAISITSKSLT